MDNVISFPDRLREEASPWHYVTYEFVTDLEVFRISAWPKSGSVDPHAIPNILGERATIRGAAAFAHAKAAQLGIPEVLDLTDILSNSDGVGGAA